MPDQEERLEQDGRTLHREKNSSIPRRNLWRNARRELERGNLWMDKTFADTKAANAEMTRQNSELEKRKSELVKENSFSSPPIRLYPMRKSGWRPTGRKWLTRLPTSRLTSHKLIEERSACVQGDGGGRKEKETALQEAAEASAARFQPQGCPQQFSPTGSLAARPET